MTPEDPKLREDLATSIYVAIRTAPKHIRRGIVAKLPQDGDRATRELAEIIVKVLDGYEIRPRPGYGAGDAMTGSSRL
ncbi:MAG: hypothetical protein AAFR68_18445 [Pseudomonadota bacterium]